MKSDGDAAIPMSDVEEQLTNLHGDTRYLRELIDMLEDRLKPVLKEEMAESSAKDSVSTYIVPLAENLRDVDYAIREMHMRITSINSRLGL